MFIKAILFFALVALARGGGYLGGAFGLGAGYGGFGYGLGHGGFGYALGHGHAGLGYGYGHGHGGIGYGFGHAPGYSYAVRSPLAIPAPAPLPIVAPAPLPLAPHHFGHGAGYGYTSYARPAVGFAHGFAAPAPLAVAAPAPLAISAPAPHAIPAPLHFGHGNGYSYSNYARPSIGLTHGGFGFNPIFSGTTFGVGLGGYANQFGHSTYGNH